MSQTHQNLSNSAEILQESDSLLASKSKEVICAECEKHHAGFHCEECGQNLCPKCDKQLHKKGKRANHVRETLNTIIGNSHFTSSDEKTDKTSSVRSSLEQLSLTSKKVANFTENKDSIKTGTKQKSNQISEEVSNQTKNNILEKLNESPIDNNEEKIDKYQKLHESLNITTNENYSFALSLNNESHFINQSFTEDFAREIPIENYQGYKNIELLNSFDLSLFIQKILRSYAEQGDVIIKKEVFEQNLMKNYKHIDVSSLLKEAEEKKIIQIISRKFGDSKPIFYISLFLDNLSIQALFWAIKSLINDQLTPNEKMILSRIKEAFAIKLNPVIWQGIWKFLRNKSIDHDNFIIVPNIVPLKIIETYNQQGSYLKIITIKDVSPLLIDQESLTLKDQQIWEEFLKFLDGFFEEKSGNTFTKKAEKAKWSSSVETFLSKNKTKPLIIPPKSSSKAIPGGKYGCAQLIKCCGPENLASLSLGKLSVLAQEAINRKLLDHYKTLLIKSTRFVLGIKLNESPLENIKLEEKPEVKMKIQTIKRIVLELLKDAPNGYSLAKLPAEIKKKVNFYYDLHEIGFNKLKDFLAEMPNVELIEMKGSKLSIAKLRKTEYFNNESNTQHQDPELLFKNLNESILHIIENQPQSISVPELLTSVKNISGNDYRFINILSSPTNFFRYLIKNFEDIINIDFDKNDVLIRHKTQLQMIIPKNLANTNFSNDTLKSDLNADSLYNSGNKSYTFYNSNTNTSLFNTNVSSITHKSVMTPFFSNKEENKNYNEILTFLQKNSLEQSHGNYSYFGNRHSVNNPITEKNEKIKKKKNWDNFDSGEKKTINFKNFESKTLNQDPALVDYLGGIGKSKDNSIRFNSH